MKGPGGVRVVCSEMKFETLLLRKAASFSSGETISGRKLLNTLDCPHTFFAYHTGLQGGVLLCAQGREKEKCALLDRNPAKAKGDAVDEKSLWIY